MQYVWYYEGNIQTSKKPTQRDTRMELVCMIAKNESKGIHTFCPAPWAVRGGLCSLS